MRNFSHKVVLVLKRVNKVLTELGSAAALRYKELIIVTN